MSRNRDLIDAIKSNFARKSSAQLQEIVQANNPERWSPEAIAAADEVLIDRMAGRAQEPLVPEEEPRPPSPVDPYSLALLVGLSSFAGVLGHAAARAYTSEYYFRERDRSDEDLPVPFGPKMAWLALETSDTEAVAAALGLRDRQAATWVEGIDAAHQSSIFVTPPLADWTLAVGAALFPPDRAEAFVKPLLEHLSRQFGDAQYFCTHGDFVLHVWARARHGRLIRGYGWLGEKGLTLWDEGTQTKEERELAFQSLDRSSPESEQGQKRNVDESFVMQLASLWSLDPTTLDAQLKEPRMGFVGNLAKDRSQTNRSD